MLFVGFIIRLCHRPFTLTIEAADTGVHSQSSRLRASLELLPSFLNYNDVEVYIVTSSEAEFSAEINLMENKV